MYLRKKYFINICVTFVRIYATLSIHANALRITRAWLGQFRREMWSTDEVGKSNTIAFVAWWPGSSAFRVPPLLFSWRCTRRYPWRRPLATSWRTPRHRSWRIWKYPVRSPAAAWWEDLPRCQQPPRKTEQISTTKTISWILHRFIFTINFPIFKNKKKSKYLTKRQLQVIVKLESFKITNYIIIDRIMLY